MKKGRQFMSTYNRRNHRKVLLQAHIIFVTKYRKKIINEKIDKHLKQVLSKTASENLWRIVTMESDKDHIHILLEYDATQALCNVVKTLKQVSTFLLWQQFGPFLCKQYWAKNIFGSRGYFACSVGNVSSAIIQKYIASQG